MGQRSDKMPPAQWMKHCYKVSVLKGHEIKYSHKVSTLNFIPAFEALYTPIKILLGDVKNTKSMKCIAFVLLSIPIKGNKGPQTH